MRIYFDDNNYKLHFGLKGFKSQNVLTKEELSLLRDYRGLYDYSSLKPAQWKAKRVLDVGLSLVGSILTAPIMLLSAFAVKLSSKGPVFFKQERIGKNGNTFIIYKFRTMKNNSATDHNVQNSCDERVTKVGRFLRKFSLDELPQFFNIIKGDMSIVGPRPLPLRDHKIRKQGNDFVIRYVFKPGASLYYEKSAPPHFIDDNPEFSNIAEKEYVSDWNLKKDFKACIKTLSKMLRGDNY